MIDQENKFEVRAKSGTVTVQPDFGPEIQFNQGDCLNLAAWLVAISAQTPSQFCEFHCLLNKLLCEKVR